MKNTIKILMLTAGIIIAAIAASQAQSTDGSRMERDVQIADNVLETMIKQKIGQRGFFPLDVQGVYLPGYGVTFRLPGESSSQMYFITGDRVNINRAYGSGNSYSISGTSQGQGFQVAQSNDTDECEDCPTAKTKVTAKATARAPYAKKNQLKTVNGFTKVDGSDSARNAFHNIVLEVSKEFLADYGDLLTQLTPEERIVITNRAESGNNNWLWKSDGGKPRKYMTMEVIKSDITAFKQGKLSRDQFMSKIKIIDAETDEKPSQDLELLSSIFNRLYQADLSKTFFVQEEIYYERLKDYGAIYEMHVYSSNGLYDKRYNMPTIGLNDVDKTDRDKHVTELYPSFEESVVDDVLEYGKTLRSLKDNEALVFNIKLTQCKGCGIPSTLEISIKESVLKDYSSGKITKEAALTKVVLKKGPNQ